MNPKINSTSFGSITVNENNFEKDILIRMSGQMKNVRKSFLKKSTVHPIKYRLQRRNSSMKKEQMK